MILYLQLKMTRINAFITIFSNNNGNTNLQKSRYIPELKKKNEYYL